MKDLSACRNAGPSAQASAANTWPQPLSASKEEFNQIVIPTGAYKHHIHVSISEVKKTRLREIAVHHTIIKLHVGRRKASSDRRNVQRTRCADTVTPEQADNR